MKIIIPFLRALALVAVVGNSQAQPLVSIETVTVRDEGNSPDSTGFGAVSYPYRIGKFEVTTEQYTAFLNAVASTNTNAYVVDLWNPLMAENINVAGISRTGSVGNYTYAVMDNSGYSGQRPVSYISWFDAARFANFLHNGATNGANTEDGAYTLNGATTGQIPKNEDATYWIPSEDEWYKAAYYKGGSKTAGYWLFPTQSDAVPQNDQPTSPNQGNFYRDGFSVPRMTLPAGSDWIDLLPSLQYLTTVGFFSNSPSAYGTFDQAGSMWEWNDAIIGASRGLRGGHWFDGAGLLESVRRDTVASPDIESYTTGFRLATRDLTAMVLVKGGVLPSSSELSGQSVNSFRIGKSEITWGEWRQVRDWAVTNGYADLSSIGTGGSDDHPVRLVNWYDAVKWCNAKSEKEGLKPVYLRSGQVYRVGEGPSDSPYDPNSPVLYVIDRDLLANGYRLPTDAEWEWAARGGISSRGFTYSGSDDLNDVGWFLGNSSGAPAAFLNGRGTYPVGLKQPNELGIYDMSGNASEWVWDPFGDWRRVRGGAFHNPQEQCAVSERSADAAAYRDSDTYVKGGFRVASNTPLDFDSDEDGVNDYREGKDGTDPNDASSFNPLSKGMIAFYPLDGNGDDDSGYGRHLTLRQTGFISGTRGQSLNFSESSSRADYQPNTQPLATNRFSVSVWVKPDTVNRGFPEWMYLMDGSAPKTNAFLRIGVNQEQYGYSEWIFFGTGGPEGSDYVYTTNTVVQTNAWNHIVATADSSTETAVYVNGRLLQKWTNAELWLDQNNFFFGNDNGNGSPVAGQLDQIRVYNRGLSSKDVEQLFYLDAFTEPQKHFLEATPWVMGHYSQAEYNGNRTNGQTDVTTNPSAFNLFTQSQFDSNRTAGQSDVISNPMSYGLYTSNSIMDLRMGGLMIQKQGTNATVVFQPQTTTDLATQPFTNNGTPVTNTVPMTGDKGFLRIQAR